MSKKVDLEKLRSVGSLRSGYKDSTRTEVNRNRYHTGKQIEHWDGRQDAIIKPKAISLKTTVKEN